MIGVTILALAFVALLNPATAQEEYRAPRPSKLQYANLDDQAFEKPTTPVPILKQINNHNDDGSYTYGFEAADGSFKIETKEANGQVRGKYGYTDANGKLHVVEYGANKFGFQPSGEGIEVPPVNYAEPEEEIEEPEQRITQFKQSSRPSAQAIPQQAYRAPAVQAAPQPAYRAPAAQPAYRQPVQATRAPTPQPQIVYSPVPKKPSFFAGAQLAEPQEQESYDYDEPAPQPRPAPRPAARPAPISQPQPVQYAQPQQRPVKYAQPESPVANFIPSPEYSSAIQFSQPQQRASPKIAQQYQAIEQPQTLFRPEPAQSRPKPQPVRYTQTEAIIRDEPREYIPRQPKAKVGGFFDQLEEQFALPRGNAQSLHDVSFGFY